VNNGAVVDAAAGGGAAAPPVGRRTSGTLLRPRRQTCSPARARLPRARQHKHSEDRRHFGDGQHCGYQRGRVARPVAGPPAQVVSHERRRAAHRWRARRGGGVPNAATSTVHAPRREAGGREVNEGSMGGHRRHDRRPE